MNITSDFVNKEERTKPTRRPNFTYFDICFKRELNNDVFAVPCQCETCVYDRLVNSHKAHKK
jgi:hypothetical protein